MKQIIANECELCEKRCISIECRWSMFAYIRGVHVCACVCLCLHDENPIK